MGGLLGSLPYLATARHGAGSAALSAAQIFASCLLFGVTFRYVLAADKNNVQLKGGAVAAFGLVRPQHPVLPLCHARSRILVRIWCRTQVVREVLRPVSNSSGFILQAIYTIA